MACFGCTWLHLASLCIHRLCIAELLIAVNLACNCLKRHINRHVIPRIHIASEAIRESSTHENTKLLI